MFGIKRYSENILFGSAVSKTVTEYEYGYEGPNKVQEASAAERRAELRGVMEAADILGKLPNSFGSSLIMLMRWRRITVEKLAEKSLLSPKTIQRMRNNHNQQWDIEFIVAVCVGLQLPPYISMPLIEKAGLRIRANSKDILYAYLLATHYQSPIFEFNEYLEAVGYPPLSGIE